VFIERLWRSLEYECVYLSAFETGSQARDGIGRWIAFFNERRPHSSFGGRTPAEVYAMKIAPPRPGLAPAPTRLAA
jgi:putative transposase